VTTEATSERPPSRPGTSRRTDGAGPQSASSLLVAARVCLLSMLLLATSVSSIFADRGDQSPHSTYYVLAGLFAFAGLSAWWAKRHGDAPRYLGLQLGGDVLTVSGVIYATGGPASPLLFLYIPLVMIVAMAFSRNHAFFVTVSATTLQSVMSYCLINRYLLPLDGGPTPNAPAGGLLLQTIGLASGMILTAVLTGFLTRAIRSSSQLVEQSRIDLEYLTRAERELREKLDVQERLARLFSRREPQLAFSPTRLGHFVGESGVMQKVFQLIERVANSDTTVLISGESGTGKELVARAIHLGSSRADGPFVAVNCGAIPENLIESQLFGHKRGAFTGAEADFIGYFRQADGGTIFLDEIGELPLLMQTKLLRSIQERCVRPVGGSKDIAIDVRIVTATNRTLKNEVEAGTFREDLFYRLNVINVPLPPLRARKDDIPLLIHSIMERLIPHDREPLLPPGTMDLLMAYDYPGNVRELENILERAFVLGGEVILAEHLPEHLRTPQTRTKKHTEIIIDERLELPVQLDEILAMIEKRYLEVALLQTSGAKKRAADLLGINFRSFRYRLEKFGIGGEGE
jgi:two-component system response regulator PilR (NtrC family)